MILDNNTLKVAYLKNGITSNLFYGDVLVLGLGTGIIINDMNADSIDVIEINQDIINEYGNKLNVIHEDAYKYKTNKLYDVIFLDIWYHKTNISELETLLEHYKNNLKPNGKFIYLPLVFGKG